MGSTRSRPSRSRRVHSKPRLNPRTRSGTTSSTQTNTPTIHADDNANIPPSHKKGLVVPVESETRTPTRASFLDISQEEESISEPLPSPPVSQTDVQDTLPSVTKPTPVGPTDDSDTDFQSAYSASPRENYGNFDSEHANLDIVDDTLTLQIKSQENVEDRLSAAPKTRRERVSSTSTAIIIRESADTRAANLTTPRSRVASKHV